MSFRLKPLAPIPHHADFLAGARSSAATYLRQIESHLPASARSPLHDAANRYDQVAAQSAQLREPLLWRGSRFAARHTTRCQGSGAGARRARNSATGLAGTVEELRRFRTTEGTGFRSATVTTAKPFQVHAATPARRWQPVSRVVHESTPLPLDN